MYNFSCESFFFQAVKALKNNSNDIVNAIMVRTPEIQFFIKIIFRWFVLQELTM